VYGKSKLAGEKAIQGTGCHHLIFRTSWVYASRGKNFLLTILRLAKERPELQVLDDQHGAPTWARNIAEATTQILRQRDPPSGIYHLTAAGETTWVRVRARDRAAKRTIDTREGHWDRRVPDASEASNELRSRHTKARTTLGVVASDWREAVEVCMNNLVEHPRSRHSSRGTY
jgi:dTDP-4-dehydrorhamnose reductase